MIQRSTPLLSLLLALLAASVGASAQMAVTPGNGGIQLPPGFQALVVADHIGEARQIAVRENGDIYAALMKPIDLGYVVAMRDTDGDGVMDVIKHFGELDSMCKSLKLYKNYLYVASTTQVVRFPMDERQLLPTAPHEVIVSGFPEPKSHRSKIIDFDASGNLYVATGSPSNSCQEVDRTQGSPGKLPCDELDRYAGVWMFDAEELGQTQLEDGFHYATGIRNAVAFRHDPVKEAIYAVQNGRDSLHQDWGAFYDERQSAELPSEEFQLIKQGSDFGWPYTYYDHERQTRIVMPEYGGDGNKRPPAGQYDDPIIAFPGHWAPVGLQFYNARQFPKKYQGGAFVAFHGSWNRAPLPQQGYNIAFVPFDGQHPSGEYEIFADGFKGAKVLHTPNQATYRPTGLTLGPDGSLYVAEDQVGRIWKIMYTGGKGVPVSALSRSGRQGNEASTTSAKPVAAMDLDPAAHALYIQHCLACHQIDGSGVPNMQPSLIDSERLSGQNDYISRLMLQGSGWVEKRHYNNLMTTFAFLSDDEIASILNYVKARFGQASDTISPSQIAAARAKYAN